MSRLTVVGLLVVWAVGCVAAPPRRQPGVDVPAPDRFAAATEASGAPISGEWWSEFDDGALNALVALALENNHDLALAAARLERAAAEARIAGADLEPRVSLGTSAARQRQNFVGFPIPGGGSVLSTTSTRVGLSLDTAWEVDLWGRLRAGARAALAETQAADADLAAARLSIAGQTAKTWFAVVEAAQQVDLARRSAASFEKLADQVRSRYEQGLRPALDLRLALSNLASAEALLALRQEQLERAARQLEVLLGRYPAGELVATHAAEGLPTLPRAIPPGLPAELVSRRPDLVAAERRLAASDQRALQARRALYPRLSLTASGGTVSDQFRDLLDGDFRVWSIVGNLLQPIFEGGRLRAGVDRALAVEEEALARYAQSVLRAYAEVESALVAESLLVQREGHVAETARQLTAARALAEDRYREGVGDYLTVLESQTRALAAEGELISVRRALLSNRIDIYLALGGGFEAPEDASS